MDRPSRILILEDNSSDAELERRELRRAGLVPEIRVAADRDAYLRTLDEFVPDLILADYSIPGFDGLSALAAAKKRFPDVPVVIVSGVIGEEAAVEALIAGATDYVLKNRLIRLGPVTRRALLEAEQHAEAGHALKALLESETLLRAVIDNSPDAIYVKDRESRWLMANPAVLRIVGKTSQEALGKTDFELYDDPKVGLAIVENDQRVLTGGVATEFEEVADTPDGRRLFLSIKAPRRDAQGRIVGIVGISRDITDRKMEQEQLKAAYALLDQRVRDRTEELRGANTTLRMISDCNEALIRATDEADLMRQVCRIVVEVGEYRMAWVGYAEDDDGKTVRPVGAAGADDGYLKKARITWGENARGQGPTGACIQTGLIQICNDIQQDPNLKPWRSEALKRGFRSSIALPLISEGRTLGALTIYAGHAEAFGPAQTVLLTKLAENLAFGLGVRRTQAERDQARETAERRAAQLQALAAELVRAESKERRRLAGVLHDNLQQLLVSAKYSATAIRNGSESERSRKMADRITEALDEAIHTSRSLSHDLSPPVLHEKGLAAGLHWLGRQMKERHDLAVEVLTDESAEPAAEQLRIFLFDAARELLLNVVKHAQVREAQVRMQALDRDKVEVMVSDAGSGFDPAEVAGRGSTEGGFGLFSIRERLVYLGGRMDIAASPGKGSRFTLVAPTGRGSAATVLEPPAGEPAPRPAEEAARPAPKAGANAGGKIRVLLADDHAVVRRGFARLLEGEKDIAIVGEAGDGREAIELARKLRPEVVLMDVSMPLVNGCEATRQIISEMPGVRVVGLSMHEEGEIAVAMLKAGAAAFVTKSGPPKDLLDAIRAGRRRKKVKP